MPLLRPFSLILASFYLIGPLLILGELLRPEISVPIIGFFLLWAIPLACSRFASAPVLDRPFAAPLVISSIAAAALCFAWVYLSGIGGYAYLHWDYMKHNLIFSTLLDQFLPAVTDNNGSPFIVHYSFAYYITPVRLHQLLGAGGLRVALDPLLVATYTSVLFVSVFLLARGRVPILLLTVMLIFSSGWDLIGWWAWKSPLWIGTTVPYVDIKVPANLEWWGIPYAPQSLSMNLFWAPQHFFGALVGTALLFVIVETDRPMAVRLVDILILVVASAYWSPYVAVGLSVLAVIKLLVNHQDVANRLREEGAAPLLTFRFGAACPFAGAFALITALFYAAAEPLSAPRALLHDDKSILLWLLTYLINYAPPLILLVLIFWRRAWRPDVGAPRYLAPMLVGCLAASGMLLLIVHGRYDDWGMRTTLPFSIALALLLTQGISAGLRGAYLALMVSVIVLSSASDLSQIAQGLLLPPNRAPYGSFAISQMGDIAFQYQGRADSLLYRYLARR